MRRRDNIIIFIILSILYGAVAWVVFFVEDYPLIGYFRMLRRFLFPVWLYSWVCFRFVSDKKADKEKTLVKFVFFTCITFMWLFTVIHLYLWRIGTTSSNTVLNMPVVVILSVLVINALSFGSLMTCSKLCFFNVDLMNYVRKIYVVGCAFLSLYIIIGALLFT